MNKKYLHTPVVVRSVFCFFTSEFCVKQKNRHRDGSFALREKVYEEMQDRSVSLKTDCLCNYIIICYKKSLSKDSTAE